MKACCADKPRRRSASEIDEGNRSVGPSHAHRSAGNFQIADSGFERFGPGLLELGSELARRPGDRGTSAGNRARSPSPGSGSDQIGVALHYAHPVGREVEGNAPLGVGHSLVAAPDGSVVVSLADAPDYRVVDLDLGLVEKTRTAIPVLQNARDFS